MTDIKQKYTIHEITSEVCFCDGPFVDALGVPHRATRKQMLLSEVIWHGDPKIGDRVICNADGGLEHEPRD